MASDSMDSTLPAPPRGDQNRGPGYITFTTITTTAALVAVCLRMYVRIRITSHVGIDDYIIILAMVCLGMD